MPSEPRGRQAVARGDLVASEMAKGWFFRRFAWHHGLLGSVVVGYCVLVSPGEAKLELKEHFSRSKAHAGRTVDVETTDKLTDPQIVAKVKAHFGIDR